MKTNTAELKRALLAATKGPWEVEADGGLVNTSFQSRIVASSARRDREMTRSSARPMYLALADSADAYLIALLRNAADDLIAEVERARALSDTSRLDTMWQEMAAAAMQDRVERQRAESERDELRKEVTRLTAADRNRRQWTAWTPASEAAWSEKVSP